MAIIDFQWVVEQLNGNLPEGFGARVATESIIDNPTAPNCIEIYKDGLLSKRTVAILRLGPGRLFKISWADPIDSIRKAVQRISV